MKDTIYRADAIEAVRKIVPVETEIDATLLDKMDVIVELSELPSAEAVQGYTEWLEKIIVKEAIVWPCMNPTDKEWCDDNCRYSSIQAECLRHLYEVSKGGDDE